MYSDLSEYKGRLRSYKAINSNLSQLQTKLETFNTNVKSICSSIEKYDKNPEYLVEIDRHWITFNLFKDHLIPELKKYINDFSALEQIGRHIYFLKIAQRKLKNELDSDLSSSIKSLQNISIKQIQIESLIHTMNTQFGYIIPELELLKSLLQYRDSLKIILMYAERLPCYIKNNVHDFLENSKSIIQTLRDSSRTIENSIHEFNEILLKLKHKEFYKKFHPEELETPFRGQISTLITLLQDGTYYLRIIRYIIYELKIVKSNSISTISQIKSKIGQISDLNSALKNLHSIYPKIIRFYYNHVQASILLNYYSVKLGSPKFGKILKRLNEIIYETAIFIYLITVYFTILYHSNVIIKNIENLKPNVVGLKEFNKNFYSIRTFVSIIINKLDILNLNISKLESIMTDITVNNIKDKITKCKRQISVIRQIIDWLMKSFEHTREYIDNTGQELKKKCNEIIDEIQKSLDYLLVMILIKELISIPSYLIKKEYQNQIVMVLSSIKNYLNEFKSYIDLNVVNTNGIIYYILLILFDSKILIKTLESNIKDMDNWINELECAIEGVPRNFISCSLQSTNNSIYSRIGSLGVNQVLHMYSVKNVMNYKVVVNRLFESARKIDQILRVIPWPDGCKCLIRFERSINNRIILHDIYFTIIIDNLTGITEDQLESWLKLDKISQINALGISDNHMCLCMVFKYILYPMIIKIIQILGVDLDTLGTISRKFQKYSDLTGLEINITKLLSLVVDILDPISSWIRNKYYYEIIVDFSRVDIKCFCCYHEDPKYHLILNSVLVISSLIENIWAMDTESIRLSIEKISTMVSEFEKIDSQNNKSTNKNSNSAFVESITSLFCPLKICTISSKLQLISDLITLSEDLHVLESAIKPYLYTLSLTNPDIFFNSINILISNNNDVKTYIKSILVKYDSINSGKNICGQFKNYCCVVSSNIVIILSMLISVKVRSKLYPTKCSNFKDRLCSFLKTVCNCEKEDCCLKQLIDLKDQICGDGNKCEDLLKKCIDSCCFQECCKGGCPCKQLKDCCDELKKLCCDTTNGLCQILQTIKQCECNTKEKTGSCKKCICCRLVIESILILQSMFRQIVWIISKNIIVSCKYLLEILDKIKKTNNSDLIIRRIVEGNSRYNKLGISMIKNYNSYGTGSDNSTTDATSVRNWGYDTHYEHHVTTSSVSENYPNLISDRTGGSGNKMFKPVLSRLLVATIVVFMFIYLRLIYNHLIVIDQNTYGSVDNIDPNNNLDNSDLTSSLDIINSFNYKYKLNI